MRKNKLILWAGIVLGVVTYCFGYLLSLILFPVLMHGGPEAVVALFVCAAGITVGAIGYVATIAALYAFPVKWWSQYRADHKTAQLFSYDSTERVEGLAIALNMSAFACGILTNVLGGWWVEALIALAAMPTVLQLFEYMRSQAQSGNALTKVPDE